MKMIVAMIEPHKLPDVKQALYNADVTAMTITNALGCSSTQESLTETYRGIDQEMYLFKKVRLEIAVNEDFVERTIDAIVEGAHIEANGRNHGMIFILDLVDAIRLTGERGEQALR